MYYQMDRWMKVGRGEWRVDYDWIMVGKINGMNVGNWKNKWLDEWMDEMDGWMEVQWSGPPETLPGSLYHPHSICALVLFYCFNFSFLGEPLCATDSVTAVLSDVLQQIYS